MEILNDPIKCGMLIVFIISIVGAFMGFGENRKIIIFYDYDDLGLSFLVPASGFLTYYIILFVLGDNQIAFIISIIVSFILFIILIKNTYQYNQKNILYTIIALTTKIIFSVIWILNLINLINPSGKTATERRKNRNQAMLVLLLLTPIIGGLVVNKEGNFFNPKEWLKYKRVGNMRRYL